MTKEPTAIVDVQHVEKRFDAAGASTVALQDINLSIGTREFVSLIGPSGCGKSTSSGSSPI